MDNNMFYKYKETRGQSGYKSAWLYKLPTEEKYHLLCATEQVPYVFGDTDSFEIDILQSDTKGKIEGKASLEPVDVDVLHHRDNAYRFAQLDGVTLDFMSINAEFVGYTFNGTLKYKPNTAEADVNRATVTITPMSASATPIFNARPLIMETLYFKNSIDDTVAVGEAIDFSTQGGGDVTLSVKKRTVDASTGVETETDATSTKDYTLAGQKITFNTEGLYIVTARDQSPASAYASWTTTVYAQSKN
jgi:hypothetical protein